MLAVFLVFIGGGLGSAGRHLLAGRIDRAIPRDLSIKLPVRSAPFFPNISGPLLSAPFPLGTLLVNILGSFLLGFMTIFYRQYILANPTNITLWDRYLWQRIYIPLFFTGFCGGFTTFSSYTMDVCNQFLAGNFFRAWLTLSLHVIFGLLSAGAGIWLAWRIAANLAT
ncbi:CrcB family protein [Candidatus Haliotispira prima]|uniref:Fluoride-specific ion channel FluC n=1 Tax=Candidatus Haliotispira prima TaxID=3034016 RepID=A0ABY8MKE0_9SPIO|nr:CrcB family protein [Candidatus Haliotispira prima]